MRTTLMTKTTTSAPSSGKHARRRAVLGLALALSVGLGLSVAAPASAADRVPKPRDGYCDAGEFCLYYNSNLSGSVFDVWDYDFDLRNNVFPRGNAAGQKVANNTASWRNRTGLKYHVYTGVSCTGAHGYMSTTTSGNFSATFKNNVESVRINYKAC